MGEADEDVGVHNGAADQGFLRVFSAFYGDGDVIGAFQAVADNDGAADGEGREAVLPRALQVLQGIFAEAGIHRVAVGEERFSAEFLDQVGHGFGVIGTEVADVAQLSEVHFDGDELAVHIDVGDAGPAGEPFQLGGHAFPESSRPEVGVEYFCFFHVTKITKKEGD